jgi:ubiquinol-cytochrome c reductase cytochrome b subunit
VGLGDWLNERTGHRDLIRHALDEPVIGGARWMYVFGSALTLSLVVQVVTGWLLMSAYAPSATTAWASVAHISYSMSMGWLVRGLHHFGAQAMVVLVFLHLVQTALVGAYKKPREVNWLLGLGLLGLTMGFALTGYLLPWDQKGYWATRVATNIVGTVPLVGSWMQGVLVGGAEYGHMTLTRFYALHVAVLPALTVLLFVAHVALFRRHGVTPPAGADMSKVDRFYPKQVAMDLAAGVVALAVIFALTMGVRGGAPLDAPADPSSDYPARPEWYFLSLFELLKYFHGNLEPVGAVGLPLLIVGYLVALPFIDKRPDRSVKRRLAYLAPLALIGLATVGLTLKSMRDDANDEAFQRSRKLATTRSERAAALFKAGVPPEGPLAMMRSDPQTRGPELFATHCASCHKLNELAPPDGKLTAPDLTDFGSKAWALRVLDHPDAEAMFGNTPFKEQMPSMTRPPADPEAAKVFTAMSKPDQDAVADFLEAQARGEKADGTPGEKLVKQRCTSCHRLDGKTDDEDSLAPELRGWASLSWIEAQIENPASGKTYPKKLAEGDQKGLMPAYEDKLSAADRKLLAVWLVSQREKGPR